MNAKWPLMLLILAMARFGSAAAFGETKLTIDTSQTAKGIVRIAYATADKQPAKVLIVKDQQRYTYQLNGEGRVETYPLQMGDGQYSIGVLENVKGNTYAFVENKKLDVKLDNPDAVFLASIQEVNWDIGSDAVKKSLQLIGKEGAQDKRFDLVYDYLVKNLSYDYAKIPSLKAGYLPDVDQTLSIKKGICYDYSALLAAMIRSQGIPTKLVKGYTKNTDVFHAWNEVKINGEWWIIDTTIDSISLKQKVRIEKVKHAADYKKVSEY